MLHPGSNLATDVVLSQGTHGPNEPTPWGGELPVGPEGQKLTIAPNQRGDRLGDPHSVTQPPGSSFCGANRTFGPETGRGGVTPAPVSHVTASLQFRGGQTFLPRARAHSCGPTHRNPRWQHRTPHASETKPGARTTRRNPNQICQRQTRPLLTAGKDG